MLGQTLWGPILSLPLKQQQGDAKGFKTPWTGAADVAQQLRALIALAEDLGWLSSTHMMA